MEIAGATGTPLIINDTTQKRTFRQYARVLMDTDFSRHLFYEIMVEREGFAFPVEVEYECYLNFVRINKFMVIRSKIVVCCIWKKL